MKKMILKLMALILVFVSSFSLIGCGGVSKSTLYVLSYKPEYKEFFDYLNSVYLKENPEIKKIDYKAVDTNNYNTIFNSRVQSKYLDVFTSEVSFMMQGSSNYMKELSNRDYFSTMKQEYLDLGKLYDSNEGGEPKQLTVPMEFVGSVVFYNKDIFTEYGVHEPKSWTEFTALLSLFQENAKYPVTGKTKIEAPLIFGGKSEWPSMTILNSIVADTIELNDTDFFDRIKNYDTDSSVRFNNPNWVSVFNKIKDIAGFIPALQYGLDYAYAPSYFTTGNVETKKMYPMMIDGSWSYSQIDAQFEVGAFVLPSEENCVNQDGKKNFATKPGMTMSVFKQTNKAEAAEKYIELMFRPDIYAKFLQLTKMPSVLKDVNQKDAFITNLFDESKYSFVTMYDSRMPRYMPLPSASELISLMKGKTTAADVANNLQEQVELSKKDWQKYVHLSHTK